MFCTSFQNAASGMGPGFTLNKDTLSAWIDDLNARAVTEKQKQPCTSWMREATEQLVLKAPSNAFDPMVTHYKEFTWERCCFNTEMLRCALWGLCSHSQPSSS